MGIVIKQSSRNLVSNYLGIALGFVNTVLLFPNIMAPSKVGLIQFLLSTSLITSQLGQLGIPMAINKYFPNYNEADGGKHRFINTIKAFVFFSFIFAALYLLFFKQDIINTVTSKSPLAANNYNFLILLTLFFMIMNISDSFIRISEFKTVYQTFVKNVVVRILVFINLVLFYLDIFNFNTFLLGFIGVYLIVSLLFFIKAWGSAKSKWSVGFLKGAELKKISKYMFFAYLSSFSNNVINQIDKFMLAALSGLSPTAVYAVSAHIGTVIFAPYRSIANISTPLISKYFTENRIDKIEELYQKTSHTMIVIGSTLFLFIWVNIGFVYQFIPKIYEEGIVVLFWLGLTKIIDMTFGVNGLILVNSNHYRYDLYTKIFLVAMTVVTNLILIPIMGIEGAAIATFASVLTYNIVKLLIIKVKLNIVPFTNKLILATLLFGIVISIERFSRNLIQTEIVQLITLNLIVCVLYVLPVYKLKISEDINNLINKIVKKF